ncbi:MAG: hypothetical protein RL021_1604 [Bacteroidota bacterium]|jgi:SAM-dependent methyltransferase
MENLLNCPVCEGSSFEIHHTSTDYTVSGKTFDVQKCNSCGFLFTNPRPSQAEIGPFYESKDYISHSNSKKGLFNKVYQQVRDIAIHQKTDLISKLTGLDGLSLLDIGCGTGEFLAGCKAKGWSVRGVEPGNAAREQAITNHGLQVTGEEYLNKSTDSYDVITMWHVLEHVHDLNPRIDQVYRLLKREGVLIIAVPNHTSYDASAYGKYWAAWDVPRHLYHFSPATIKKLLLKHGFRHTGSYPMKFDAYYVSLLSEGYTKGKKQNVFGLLKGFRSNIAANKNAEKYSSVIYVFKKS